MFRRDVLFAAVVGLVGWLGIQLAMYLVDDRAADDSPNEDHAKAAAEVLVREVIEPDTLGPEDSVVAFRLDSPLPAGTRIAPYLPDPLPLGEVVPCDTGGTVLQEAAWFFWIDDEPNAAFSHPTRYALIGADGKHVQSVTDQGWPPCVNGEVVQRWIADGERTDPANRAFAKGPVASQRTQAAPPRAILASVATSPFFDGSPSPFVAAITDDGLPHTAILAVNGWVEGQSLGTAMRRDLGRAQVFADANRLPVATITVSKDTRALDQLRAGIDQLAKGGANSILLAVDAHGSITVDGESYLSLGGQRVKESDLGALLGSYATSTPDHPAVDFNLAIGACRSGGFQRLSESTPNVQRVETCAGSIHDVCYGDDAGDDAGLRFLKGLWGALGNAENTALLRGPCPGCALAQAAEAARRGEMIARFKPLAKDPKTGKYVLPSAPNRGGTARPSPGAQAEDGGTATIGSPTPGGQPSPNSPGSPATQGTNGGGSTAPTTVPPTGRPTTPPPTAVPPTARPTTPPPTATTPSIAAAVAITSATCRYVRSTGPSDWVNEVTVTGTASGPPGTRISSFPTSSGYLELAVISVASWAFDGQSATRGASQPATTTWTLRQVVGRGPNSRPTTVTVILRDPNDQRFQDSRTYSCPGP